MKTGLKKKNLECYHCQGVFYQPRLTNEYLAICPHCGLLVDLSQARWLADGPEPLPEKTTAPRGRLRKGPKPKPRPKKRKKPPRLIVTPRPDPPAQPEPEKPGPVKRGPKVKPIQPVSAVFFKKLWDILKALLVTIVVFVLAHWITEADVIGVSGRCAPYIFMVVGGICLILAVWLFLKKTNLILAARLTHARITRISSYVDSEGTLHGEFQHETGKLMSFTDSVSTNVINHVVGDLLEIYYRPGDPTENSLRRYMSLWMPYTVFIVIAFFFGYVGLRLVTHYEPTGEYYIDSEGTRMEKFKKVDQAVDEEKSADNVAE